MSWNEKLKRLQENLDLTTDGLASTLGITPRTLADFMKPVEIGGREPTGPVQRLIDLLSGELDSQGLAKKPQLNLVIIHGDFRVQPGEDAVSTVVEMHRAAGTPHRNNEFHYITVEPERDRKWAFEGLVKRRVQPHFFVADQDFSISNSLAARDCYFTATAVWLATQAIRRDLAHITIAADPVKFWPLAKELKGLADVDVTFVRESVPGQEDLADFLQTLEIQIADPSGRKFGYVTSLKSSSGSKIDFGFITPEQQSGDSAKKIQPVFFSFNHMFKRQGAEPEIEISELVEGDYVSFSFGMNNKGVCATNVAIVKRADGAPPVSMSRASIGLARRNVSEETELLNIVKDAVLLCANEKGWALLSAVGNHAIIRFPDFKERYQSLGYSKIASFVAKYPEVFEASPGGVETGHAAACMRLKAGKNSS